MKKKALIIIASLIVTLTVFSIFGKPIETFNAGVRRFVMRGEFAKFQFNDRGIPSQTGVRVGDYTSPFYVVHYGLIYSNACRMTAGNDGFHWLPDETAAYWPGAPDRISKQYFRNSLDWLVSNVTTDAHGNAHFIYDFDWPYAGYPDGRLGAGWWSGLTDGYAILLLLRGYDCFSDERYLDLATKLYHSVLTPVEQGGSLIVWDGHPWIEEYVDPDADASQMSRVLNGMIYAYLGVKSYEEYVDTNKLSGALYTSINYHLPTYDLGLWSYYDAIGSHANVKYHSINWALISDPRLAGVAGDNLEIRWHIGVIFSFLYLLFGPMSVSLLHAWVSALIFGVVIYIILKKLLRA